MDTKKTTSSSTPVPFFLAFITVIVSVVLAIAGAQRLFLNPIAGFRGSEAGLSAAMAIMLAIVTDIVLVVIGLIGVFSLAMALKKNKSENIRVITIIFGILGAVALLYLVIGWFT